LLRPEFDQAMARSGCPKQNRLQMSQAFPFRASMIKWALLFKDSIYSPLRLSCGIPTIQGDDPQTVLMRGGSVIVSLLGRVLAGPDYSDEKMLTAEDTRDLIRQS
jgi:hypothetical protein